MSVRSVDSQRVLRVFGAFARGVLAEGYVSEVPARMLDTTMRFASSSERSGFLNAMAALDSRAGALLLTGRPLPVSWLSASETEAILRRWRSSPLFIRRKLAAVVTDLASSALYSFPGPEWERMGYPGPLGDAPRTKRTLQPMEIESDEELHCDVVIVGSGAAGGCAAAVLAEAGLDVIVVEKGGYHSESDFSHIESEAARKMYLYGMTLATTDLGVRILAGSTLGGGTVVNFATSFPTPGFVLAEWARTTGIDAFASGEFEESLIRVGTRLGVNTDSSAAGRRDELIEEGLKKLGWHVDMMPRAARGCTQDEACGYCGFGCRVGGKQSSMRTYLEDAAAAGARIIVDAEVSNVLIADGRAVGIEGNARNHRLRVEAKAVVVAGGAIESPALLLRSGLGGRVGYDLHLHPGCAPWGLFNEEVRMWEGTTQARYSKEFREWDGGYGPIFETIPVHPGSASVFFQWLSAADHRERMRIYRNIGFCGVLTRDRSAGRVRIGRNGNPKISYKVNADDERRIAEGVVAAAKVLEAAGATEISSPHPNPVTYVPELPGAHERWADETRRIGYRRGRVKFGSWHQMGSCRMGVDPTSSVVGPDNESHEVPGLYVVDSSAFPTASGVNPMMTVYGIAHRAATKLATRLS
jgi:long-chain-alcohol oxidase